MPSKSHRQRKQHTKNKQNNIQQNETQQIAEETIDANLDQLIVTNKEPTYEPRYINMSNTTNNQQQNTEMCEGGSLFRNCAMAIAGKSTIKPLEDSTINKQANTDNKQNNTQQEVEKFESIETNNEMDQNNLAYDEKFASPVASSARKRGIDYFEQPQYNQYDYYSNSCGEVSNNVVFRDPMAKRYRRFNKKVFRIFYYIIIISILLLTGALCVIKNIKQYKLQHNKFNIEQQINDGKLIDNSYIDTNINNITNIQPLITTNDKNDMNTLFGGDLNNIIEKPKAVKLRDEHGRFMKQSNDDVL